MYVNTFVHVHVLMHSMCIYVMKGSFVDVAGAYGMSKRKLAKDVTCSFI